MRWKLRIRFARAEQSLLFDMFKAFDWIESCQKSKYFYPKRPVFLHAHATCLEVPSNINTMVLKRAVKILLQKVAYPPTV